MIIVSEHRCQTAVNKIKKQIPTVVSFSQFESEFKRITGVHCFHTCTVANELMLRFDKEVDFTMFLLKWS